MARRHNPAQKHGNALRPGNAGITAAVKLSQLRYPPGNPMISAVIYVSPFNFLSLVQGVPARLQHGEDSPLVRLAHSLLIADLLDEELR